MDLHYSPSVINDMYVDDYDHNGIYWWVSRIDKAVKESKKKRENGT